MELMIIEEREVLGYEFRVYGTAENPLFLAKDVAEWIDYAKRSDGTADVTNMLRTVSEEEKMTRTIFASSKMRSMWFLTESGLYEVLMQSRKPITKAFKANVKTILHEIRMKGGYIDQDRAAEFLRNSFSWLSEEALRAVAADMQTHNQDLEREKAEAQAEIKALTTINTCLSGETLQWADRSFVVAAVRRLAFSAAPRARDISTKMGVAWGIFNDELLYKHHISINGREIDQTTGKRMDHKSKRLNVLTEEEVPIAVKTIVALCNHYGADLSGLLKNTDDGKVSPDMLMV